LLPFAKATLEDLKPALYEKDSNYSLEIIIIRGRGNKSKISVEYELFPNVDQSDVKIPKELLKDSLAFTIGLRRHVVSGNEDESNSERCNLNNGETSGKCILY
jgi:hypothetical protein